jgi:hypothetical protein
MEKQDMLTKKNLKRRLSAIMVVYMDGISEKKQAKLSRYLDTKLDNVVNYYLSLLKKNKRKKLFLKPLVNETLVNDLLQEPQTQQA